jgi:xylulokinase
MAFVLEISWSAPATTVRVRDTAAHTVVVEAVAPHPPGPTPHHQDPTDWWTALVGAITEVTSSLAARDLSPDALAMVLVADGDPPGGLVALDVQGAVVGPAVLGSHEASAADADWLVGQVPGGAEAWREATGATPGAGTTVALLSWLHRSDADAWTRLHHVTLPTGWLIERLTGNRHLGSHAAAGTGVLDRHTSRAWRTDLLSVVDPDRDWAAALPGLVVPADPAGGLTPDAARALGLPTLLPVHAGGALPRP